MQTAACWVAVTDDGAYAYSVNTAAARFQATAFPWAAILRCSIPRPEAAMFRSIRRSRRRASISMCAMVVMGPSWRKAFSAIGPHLARLALRGFMKWLQPNGICMVTFVEGMKDMCRRIGTIRSV